MLTFPNCTYPPVAPKFVPVIVTCVCPATAVVGLIDEITGD